MTTQQTLNVNDHVRLLQNDIFRDDDDQEIITPVGTLGTVVAIDSRPERCINIYEVQWENNTFTLYCPEEDGPQFLERI